MPFKDVFSKAFRHEKYRKYFFLQFFSFTGTWIQGTAQGWLVYRLTESAFFLGAVHFAGAIPALFLAPIAGVVADNFKRQNILIATQALCLLHGIAITALYFTGIINEWHVLYLSILLGIANAFDMTARQSFVPSLIAKEDLTNAIALNSSMFNTARMLGPAAAGFIIASYGEGICFLLNAISYIPIFIFISTVSVKKQVIKKSEDAIAHLKEGVKFAWDHKALRALLMLVGAFSFWGVAFTTLLPIFSDQILHKGSEGLGLLSAFSGVGAVCGGLFLASRKKVIGIKRIIASSSISTSICLMIFSYSTNFLLSSLMMLISGFGFIIIFAGSNTMLQALSPDHLRGRIISLFSTMLIGMYPIGSLISGFLGQQLGVQAAVLIGSIICLSFATYFNSMVPALLKDAIHLLDEQKKAEGFFKRVT